MLFLGSAAALTQTVSVGVHPTAVAVNTVTNKIYIADYSARTITVLDGASKSTTEVQTGAFPSAVAVNEITNKIYVANQGDNNVTVIDGTTNSTATVPAGKGPASVAINPVTNQVYVANFYDHSVTVIDGASGSVTTIMVGSYPYSVAVNEITNRVYVANMGSNTVTVIEGTTGATSTVPSGSYPDSVAVNSTTNQIYVANYNGNGSVTVIDGATNAVSPISAGGYPAAIVVNPNTNFVYTVNNVSSGTVTAIDGSSKSTTALPIGSYPVAVAINLERNEIYTANSGDSTVSIIDLSNSKISTVPVGTWPKALAVDPRTNALYVANYNDNTVTVIEDSQVSVPPGSQAVLTPDTISFGNQTVSTVSSSQFATLWNPGDATLNITSIGVIGDNPSAFALTSGCGSTLPAGNTCKLLVTFSPGTTGPFNGTITISDDATGSPQTVALVGDGTSPLSAQAVVTPTALTFGSQTVGTRSASRIVTLANAGTATLNMTRFAVTGTNPSVFQLTNTCGQQLPASSSCEISVSFTPNTNGSLTGALTITDDAANSPQTVSLSGTGVSSVAPLAVLQPSAVGFENQAVGTTSSSRVIALTNQGTSLLNIAGIGTSGNNANNFTVHSDCGAILAVGSSCSISVAFVPSAAGSAAATLSVRDDATDSPQTVALTGLGVVTDSGTGGGSAGPDFAVATSTPPQTISAGNVAQFTISVLSISGTFNGSVSLAASGLPPGAIATFTPSTAIPGPTGATSILAIQTQGVRAQLRGTNPKPDRQTPWEQLGGTGLLAIAVLPFQGLIRRNPRRCKVFFLCLFGLLLLGMLSCGGSSPSTVTSNNYTITVTGTSGSTRHTTNITLTLQ